ARGSLTELRHARRRATTLRGRGALLAGGACTRIVALRRSRFEDLLEQFVHRLDEADPQRTPHLLRHVVEVLRISLRQQHGLDAGPPGGQYLLLDAADGEAAAAEGGL